MRIGRIGLVVGAAAVVAAGILVAVQAASGSPTYALDAVFPSAPGLFPGAAVEVLGVRVGTVTSVRPVADEVVVAMALDAAQPVPARATASLVSPELLGEPDIELDPGYTGGPVLAAGSTIPETRTSVPVSTDQLLKSLQRTLDAVTPHAVGDLITNLANDLDGQGAGLNHLIATAAGTIQLLANKEDDLGELSGTLAQLTGTLDTRTSEIAQLITDYDTVTGVLSGHDAQLGDAITQLAGTSTQLVALLTPNLSAVEADVGTVTTTERTVDRNLGSVDSILASATQLFAAAGRVYDPTADWLTMNLALPTGVTGAYLAGLVRDRLAGICRRIAANHSSGLSAQTLQTLDRCGDPSSGFFDPVIDQFPTILDDLAAGRAPQVSPASLLEEGLAQIPGAAATAPGPSTPAPSTGAGTQTPTPAPIPQPTPTTAPSTPGGTAASGAGSGTCLGGLLGPILTCSSGTSGASGSQGAGGGSLLAYHQPVNASAPPSLTAPGAAALAPLPPTAPGASPHTAPHAHALRAHGRGHAPGARAGQGRPRSAP